MSPGGMRERPNRHAWRACVGQPTVGSNPTPSARKTSPYLQWTTPSVNPLQLSFGGGADVGGLVGGGAGGGDCEPPRPLPVPLFVPDAGGRGAPGWWTSSGPPA